MNTTQIPSDCGNYPANWPLFQIGDVVKRPNGIRNMTVEIPRTSGGFVKCLWYNEELKKYSRKNFNENKLQLVKQ